MNGFQSGPGSDVDRTAHARGRQGIGGARAERVRQCLLDQLAPVAALDIGQRRSIEGLFQARLDPVEREAGLAALDPLAPRHGEAPPVVRQRAVFPGVGGELVQRHGERLHGG